MTTPTIRYGYDLSGNKIKAKEGTTLLKEGEEIPERYLAWLNGIGWSEPRRRHYHSMENGVAQVFGNYWGYASIDDPKNVVVDKTPKTVVESNSDIDMSGGLSFD
jgi:hypothetical protein